uniref:Cyclic nucleotide-binding domain-containing protein n=2 Tax=Odontella aurita TaxID=265563 RepID=A0A7S4JSN2_9STRA
MSLSIPSTVAVRRAGITLARSLSTGPRYRRRPTGMRRGFLPRGQRHDAAALREKTKLAVSIIPKLPKPPTAIVPKPLQPLPPRASASQSGMNATAKAGGGGSSSNVVAKTGTNVRGGGGAGKGSQQTSGRWKEWLKQNAPVLILNFGSLCTLTGFTRQDVLELRALSMTGSISSVLYFSFFRPLPWAAMGWSSIFAMTNAYNIYKILDERGHRVVMSEDEEEIFVEHFMPHGLTPKQFKKVMAKAERITVQKGTAISKQGVTLDSVYLVIRGNTRGSAFGRRLSAASSVTGNRAALKGGDSGAWIGEIEFLELLWQKEHPLKKVFPKDEKEAKMNCDKSLGDLNGKEDTAGMAGNGTIDRVTEKTNVSERKEIGKGAILTGQPVERPSNAGRALYTIVAEEECELARFSHADLEDLMKSSSDMRSAMTRAMTAVVVGRVVNFTVSRSTGTPTWSTWLDQWKHSGGAILNVQSEKIVEAIKQVAPQ